LSRKIFEQSSYSASAMRPCWSVPELIPPTTADTVCSYHLLAAESGHQSLLAEFMETLRERVHEAMGALGPG
jgi:hypothetical protein